MKALTGMEDAVYNGENYLSIYKAEYENAQGADSIGVFASMLKMTSSIQSIIINYENNYSHLEGSVLASAASRPTYEAENGVKGTFVVYHGSDALLTPKSFRKRNPDGYFSKAGGSDRAIFFSGTKAPPESVYGSRAYPNQRFEVTLNNPLVVDTKTGFNRDDTSFESLVERAFEEKYDGVIIKNVHDNFVTDNNQRHT